MSQVRSTAALIALLFCTLTGCSTMPGPQSSQNSLGALGSLRGSLPDGFALWSIAKVDAGAPFALNGTGSYAAVTEGSTRIIEPGGGPGRVVEPVVEPADGPGRIIAPAPATDLRFSPDGTRLAASFATPTRTLLQLFDLQGKELAHALVPGRVTALVWRSDRELLASSLVAKKYSFGTELTSLLLRWDTVAPPVSTELSDVTVRPKVAQLPDATLFGSLTLALSPYGDEIAYSVLKDPPLFTPYLKVVVRHLENGAERGVAEIGLGSGTPLYTPEGDSLLTGDARALTRRISVPDGKETYAWASPGDHMAFSPAGSYLLLDGRLYQEGQEVTSFPQDAAGAFLPDGSGLAISSGGMLVLVTGLKDTPRHGLPKDLERILELRRLRMLGLITDQEFKTRKGKAPKL